MVQRLTYRRRHGFRTTSNKVRKVRTPGGKLVFQYLTKKSNVPRCGDCGLELQGIPATRPKIYRTLKKRERRVSRAYGGSVCYTCTRDRSATTEPDTTAATQRALRERRLSRQLCTPPCSSPLPAVLRRLLSSPDDSSNLSSALSPSALLSAHLALHLSLAVRPEALRVFFEPVTDSFPAPLWLPCLPLFSLSSLRIVRAFLIEEQKIVKAVLKQRGGKKAAAAAAEK